MKLSLQIFVVVSLLFSCGGKLESSLSADSTKTSSIDTLAEVQPGEVIEPQNKLRNGGFQSFAKGDTLIAINPSGVTMMDSPDQKGTPIKTLHYGSAVNVLENLSDGKDGLFINEVVIDTIKGKWIKVQHEKVTGFVFSAFLGRLLPPLEPKSNYQLLPFNNTFGAEYDGEPTFPCTNNFDYRPDFKYYGLYNTEEGLVLKPIDLFFYIVRRGDKNEETYFEQYVIKANTFFHPSHVFGCTDNLRPGMISVATQDSVQFVNSQFLTTTIDSISVEVVRIKSQQNSFFVRQRDEVIISKQYTGFQLYANIPLIADLNRDGINDYIFSFVDHGQWSFTGLLIGEKNNKVKLVAQYEDYSCW